MTILILALLIGVVAGLRSLTPVAVVAWAAWLGQLPITSGPLQFLVAPITPWLFTVAALGELLVDKLPVTPSRKAIAPFAARILSGALCGAAVGFAHDAMVGGLIAGAAGAVLGALGGYEARTRLAKAAGRDLPVALAEDVVAIVAAVLIVAAAG